MLYSRHMPQQTPPLQIDFVSDVACPWCAVGLYSLEEALRCTEGVVQAHLTFRPFELNPDMAAGGENLDQHIAGKYGATADQMAANRAPLRERAAGVGFEFNSSARSRVYNTFDAHRLLHWATLLGKHRELKRALFKANFTDDANIADTATLVDIATSAGLDPAQAHAVLTTQQYATEVRAEEQLWLSRGIQSVPAIIINQKWLISGGQPPEVFEDALRKIAGEQS